MPRARFRVLASIIAISATAVVVQQTGATSAEPADGTLVPADAAMVTGLVPVIASADSDAARPSDLAVDGQSMDTRSTLGSGTSTLEFDVKGSGMDVGGMARDPWLVINGFEYPVTAKTKKGNTAPVDIPDTLLSPGRNTIVFHTGWYDAGECGRNYDNFQMVEPRLVVPDGSAEGVGVEDLYLVGDGACGAPSDKLTEVTLEFDITTDAVPDAGLRAALDTTTLDDGPHRVTASFDDGSTLEHEIRVDNTAPEVAYSWPAADSVVAGPFLVQVDLSDPAGVDSRSTGIAIDDTPVSYGELIDPADLPSGSHVLTIETVDQLGNDSTVEVPFRTVERDPQRIVPGNHAAGVRNVTTGSLTTPPARERELGGTDSELKRDDVLVSESSDIPFQAFDVRAPGRGADRPLQWTGRIDSDRTAVLAVWNRAESRWDQVDAARGRDERDLTLSGRVGPAHFWRGAVHAVVYGIDPFEPQAGHEPDGEFLHPDDYDFALGHVTDTQFLSRGYVSPTSDAEQAAWEAAYADSMRWIVENAEERKIAYVGHTGDLIARHLNPDSGYTHDEFAFASRMQQILDDSGIPNGVLAGNHDNVRGDETGPDAAYNSWFGPDRYAALSGGWENAEYAGAWRPGDNQNHVDLFSAGGMDFVAVYLSYGVTEEEAQWADEILQQHSDREAIVLTHGYIAASDNADGVAAAGYSTDGEIIFEKVIEPNPNVVLVLSGHVHGVGLNVLTRVNQANSPVVENVANYQAYLVPAERLGLAPGESADPLKGIGGYLRLLQIDVDEGLMTVDTYSPSLDDFGATEFDPLQRYDGREDEFVVPLALSTRTTAVTTTSILVDGRPR